jgi:hypothetical protein
MMNFKEYLLKLEQPTATGNLAANQGEAIKQEIMKILQQPQYAQLKAAWDRLQTAPQLYQAFMQDVAKESNNTYKLPPAKYIQLIQKHSLKAAGAKLPPPIAGAPATPAAPVVSAPAA